GFYWGGPVGARARTRALDPHAQGALDAQRSLVADELQDDVENHDGRLVARDEEVEHRGSPCGTAATGGLQSISSELTLMRSFVAGALPLSDEAAHLLRMTASA